MKFQYIRRYLLLAVLGFSALPLAFAYASTSISIQSLSPSTSVGVGTNVSFNVSVAGFSNPTYTVSDSASGSSVGSGQVNASGNFSWTPDSNDVGTHNLTINVTDSLGDSATTVETINVTATPSLSIQSLSPSSNVSSGQTVTFTAAESGFSNPTYSLSDSFNGSSVSSGDINSSGNFSWVPTNNDTGTHTITVTITDNSGHSATAVETIQVNGNANATVQGFNSGTAVIVNNPITFTVAAPGFSNPVFALQDTFSGSGSTSSSLSGSDINSGGYFSWTPNSNDLGTHSITIYVNDSTGKNAVIHLTITVETPSISITDISPSTAVSPGTALAFEISQIGFTNPSYSVNDSFSGSTVSNGDIASGAFNWTPAQTEIGTHVLTITATDGNGHTANTSITIDVISPPVLVATPAPTETPTSTPTPVQTSSASGYDFETYLSPGLTSPDVTALQNILIQEGYLMVPATGYYGDLTTAAVEQFQTAHNIDSIGVVGPATRAVLNSLDGVTSNTTTSTTSTSSGYVFNNFLDIGSTGADVTALQNELTTLGDYSGPVTGYYGDLTQAAVEQFQGANNIDQVGYVGPATRAALNQQ